MASTVGRSTWTNDTGTVASPVGDGTTINNARLQEIYANIDALIAAALTVGGVLGSEGFGTHAFSAAGTGGNVLRLRNTTAGVGNFVSLQLGNDAATAVGALAAFSSTFTPASGAFADGVSLEATRAGGVSVTASHASGDIRFYTGGYNLRLTLDEAGVITPGAGTRMRAGFLAYNSATDAGVTTGATVDFDAETFDEGGDFAADVFTAPVAGRYLFAWNVRVTNTSGGAGVAAVALVTTAISNGFYSNDMAVANGATVAMSGAIVADLAAGETARLIYIGAVQVSVLGNNNAAGPRETWFSGRLLL